MGGGGVEWLSKILLAARESMVEIAIAIDIINPLSDDSFLFNVVIRAMETVYL